MTMKLIEYTDETPPRKRACINCGLRDLWALGADADTTGITSGIVIRGTSGASTGARTGERRERSGCSMRRWTDGTVEALPVLRW